VTIVIPITQTTTVTATVATTLTITTTTPATIAAIVYTTVPTTITVLDGGSSTNNNRGLAVIGVMLAIAVLLSRRR